MTETQAIWLLGAAALIALGAFAWWFTATYDEAERKLGRQPTWGELTFFVLASAVAPPLTVLAAAVYVWWVMPDKSGAVR